MKNKFISVILMFALISSSVLMIANADSIKLGDINNDGTVNSMDARLALRASASLEKLTEEQEIAADVNFDEKVNAADARIILRVASKIETLPELPSEEISSDEEPSKAETTTAEPFTGTITAEPSTETITNPPELPDDNIYAEEYPEAIDAFFSGKFYLEASAGTGDDAESFKMAMNDKGYEISASLELMEGMGEMEMGIMQLGNTLYIKYPDINGKRKFFALDEETMKNAKDLLGLDVSESFDVFLFEGLNFSSITDTNSKPVYTKGNYNGEECDIYTFDAQNGKIIFHAIGEKVKHITIIDDNGNVDTDMKITNLSKRIPGKMLSTQGCAEAELLEFMTDIMAYSPEDSFI